MAHTVQSAVRLDPALRKAAILVASLDPPLADRLLDHLPAEHAARIRRMAVELHDLDPSEQAAVLNEFFASRDHNPRQNRSKPADLRAAAPAERSAPPAVAAPPGNGQDAAHPADEAYAPFRFLRHTPGTQLAQLLAVERPQTIALVLAHLPEDDAARTLAALPSDLHLPVARRLAELEEASPDVLREVEQGLAGRIAQFQLAGARRALGLARLRGILQAADPGWSRDLIDALTAEDPQLATELQPLEEAARPSPPDQPASLETLAALSDDELRGLLSEADPEVIMLALAGASPRLARRCLALIEPSLARHIERSMARLGPLPLADISQAQAELLMLLHSPPRAAAAAR